MANLDNLITVVSEVDEFILHLAIKNSLSPLTVTAVVLARLVWLNKQAGSTDDMVKLLEDVCQKIENKELDEEVSQRLH
jgi:hypothetical protein